MWEGLSKTPLGRMSMRNFIMFVTTVLVTCFAYIFILTPTTYAQDATWDNQHERLTYDGNTYTSGESVGRNGLEFADDAEFYYRSVSTTNGSTPNERWIIYFASNTDPPSQQNATFVKYAYDSSSDTYSNPHEEAQISIANPSAATSTNSSSSSTSDGTTSCALEGIGWIVCPVTNFLAKGMDFIFGLVDGFLEVQPLATSTNNPMYRAWSYFLTVANILFIIGGLILIYAQVTGGMLSNYTIKKLLPRIIVAAVLVNTSYWICAVLIDLSNILGYALQDMFIMARNSLVGTEGNSWDVISWESMASLILSGGSIATGVSLAVYLGITSAAVASIGAGSISIGLIFLLIPLLLSVLFIVLMTFLILAARQAIITILIVLAPLAFVAYLLPNTEEWFTKWRKTFVTLLLVFPGFSIIFGGSQLAAAIIIQNASGGNAINMIILAMGVQVVPLALMPLLLKLGGGVLNRFAGVVNNPAKGIFDRGKNWAKDRSGQHQAAGIARLGQMRKAARDNGIRGLAKLDKDGNVIRDSDGNVKRNYKSHPYNWAYKRDTDRRQREGLKSANEAMSEGLFMQTTAGRRVYDRNQDAGLEKHAGENRNFRNYKEAMATGTDTRNAYRRHLHEQAHTDKGIGDIYEQKMNNEAERDFRHHVDTNQFLKDAITASHRSKKQAEEYENIVQKAAEAAYDEYSSDKNNQQAQELRLRGNIANEKATNAQKQFERVLEEARAKGYESQSVADANTLLADQLQQLTIKTSTQDSAIDSAKRVSQQNIAEVFKVDTEVQRDAAGVGGDKAIARVIANAKTTVSSAFVQDAKNIEDTLDYDLAKSPRDLRIKFDQATDMAEKVAYARAMSKNGGPGVKELRKLFTDYETDPNTPAGDLDTFKEMLASESSIMSAGKDMEFFLTKSAYTNSDGEFTDRAGNVLPPGSQPVYKTFEELSREKSTWTNMSATAFASQNATTQHFALEFLHDNYPQDYIKIINNIRNNPNAQGVIKQGVIERFSIYSDAEREHNPRLPEPGTIQ